MRHVRLGDQEHVRRDLVKHGAQELDDGVGPGQMQAGRADFLPEKRDGIQANEPRPLAHVKQQRLDHGPQYAGIPEVQIHLVGAKGGPDLARPAGGFKAGEQRQGPRTNHLRQVGTALHRYEEIVELRLTAQEALEPIALRGDMVEHPVEHQVELRPEADNVLPRAIGWIDGKEILHGEAVVR